MNRLTYLSTALLLLLALISCSENEPKTEEFVDWRARNAAFFSSKMAEANAAVAQAKQQYGDAWESHCDWRTYLSYSLEPGEGRTQSDSICAEVVRRSDGTDVRPVFTTDSVRIYFRGRLIPSASYPDGLVFSHSGQSPEFDRVFDRQTAASAMFRVSNLVRGIGTALLHMRNGDLWRIYVPHPLGYSTTGQGEIPGYSVLVFEAELLEHYRAGTSSGSWN